MRKLNTLTNTAIEHLKLSPSNIQLAGAEVELVSVMSRETRLKSSISKISEGYDYIIIDCPPSLGLLTLNALTAANTILVPIQCEYYALEGLSQLMNTVKLVQRHLNPQLDVEGVVLTMFDARTNLSIQVVDEVKKYFRNKVYRTVIPRNVRLSEAPSYGLPIILYDPKSKGAECYLELAEEVIEYTEEMSNL
jgi:chromosome partitioning protein